MEEKDAKIFTFDSSKKVRGGKMDWSMVETYLKNVFTQMHQHLLEKPYQKLIGEDINGIIPFNDNYCKRSCPCDMSGCLGSLDFMTRPMCHY